MSDVKAAAAPSCLEDQDRTICFCHNVTCATIVAAIDAGATSIEQVREKTCANTGCGGCEFEVREILEAKGY